VDHRANSAPVGSQKRRLSIFHWFDVEVPTEQRSNPADDEVIHTPGRDSDLLVFVAKRGAPDFLDMKLVTKRGDDSDIPDALDANLPLIGSRPGKVIGTVEDNITALDSLGDHGPIGYIATYDLDWETGNASDTNEAPRQNAHMGMLL